MPLGHMEAVTKVQLPVVALQHTAGQGLGMQAPMKPVVMTTGPGVIIATATASRNCRSESH